MLPQEVGGTLEAPAPASTPRWTLPLAWEVVLPLGLMGIALVMRLWDLGSRALHHDESLHAVYSWYLATGKGYRHDPMMHGPFQFHANALLFFLFGDSDFTARLLYALFGTALVGLPWLLRPQLGTAGALCASAFLAFSPTLLYFSRFARNDILMAVWAVLLIWCTWRYLESPRPGYLYALVAVLALAFATHETAYYLTLLTVGFLSVVGWRDLWDWLRARKGFAQFGPAGSLLLVLVTVTLPLWTPLVALLPGLAPTLANPDPAMGAVGLPRGAGWYVAIVLLATGFGVGVALGLWWNPRRWLVCAVIFYAIWLTFFTTVFTNPFGVFTGAWQSLGYWMAQQEVARGGQPWYYYFVVGWTYEFLPFLLALLGLATAWRAPLFIRFLAYWLVGSFILYTWTSEKMPWIMVNMAFPMALLGGYVVGRWVEAVPWRRAWERGAILAIPLVPVALMVGYRVVFLSPPEGALGPLWVLVWVGVWVAVGGLAMAFATRVGWRAGGALLGMGLVGMLGLLTLAAGWRATYRNGDVPYDLLVYTQTAPDIPRIAQDIEHIAHATGQKENMKILVDGADGFAWPWVWYLRRFPEAGYPDMTFSPLRAPVDAHVVLVNAVNIAPARAALGSDFVEARRYIHRWWHPETYRLASPRVFWEGLRDRKVWRRALDYWLYRKMGTPLGHIDAYLFYRADLLKAVP
ncbi:MAG: TIGR03663 family protein [Dehalococcoidia bacterium]|nr:TIGR03663 family protein [Dehalococcoidia bacterium]MDW8120037.1 TIGR03663 family protein [Chloroflexota bacterium]